MMKFIILLSILSLCLSVNVVKVSKHLKGSQMRFKSQESLQSQMQEQDEDQEMNLSDIPSISLKDYNKIQKKSLSKMNKKIEEPKQEFDQIQFKEMMNTMQDSFGDIGPDDIKSDLDGLKKHEDHSEMFQDVPTQYQPALPKNEPGITENSQ